MTEFDDETLMAFADGELDDKTRQAVERAMDSDDALVERVALFIRTAALSKQALEPLLDQPVPEALRASVATMTEATETTADDTVVPFAAPVQQAAPGRYSGRGMALAASVALVVGGLAGFLMGQEPDNRSGGISSASFDQTGLTEALRTVASGDEITLSETGDRLRAIASFRDAEDQLCREFQVDRPDRTTFVSVACRTGETWRFQFTVAAASQNDGGYAPASSLEALDAYLQAVGAGEPLTEGAEKAALGDL